MLHHKNDVKFKVHVVYTIVVLFVEVQIQKIFWRFLLKICFGKIKLSWISSIWKIWFSIDC